MNNKIKALLIASMLMGLSIPAHAIDLCTLLGDHAAMFAQWRNKGVTYDKTVEYINKKYGADTRGPDLHKLFLAVADDIYHASKPYSPGAIRTAVLVQCKDAGYE